MRPADRVGPRDQERHYLGVRTIDPGFATKTVVLPGSRRLPVTYTDTAAEARFYEALVDRVGAIPGVQAAAMSTGLPAAQQRARRSRGSLSDGVAYAKDADYPHLSMAGVSPNFSAHSRSHSCAGDYSRRATGSRPCRSAWSRKPSSACSPQTRTRSGVASDSAPHNRPRRGSRSSAWYPTSSEATRSSRSRQCSSARCRRITRASPTSPRGPTGNRLHSRRRFARSCASLNPGHSDLLALYARRGDRAPVVVRAGLRDDLHDRRRRGADPRGHWTVRSDGVLGEPASRGRSAFGWRSERKHETSWGSSFVRAWCRLIVGMLVGLLMAFSSPSRGCPYSVRRASTRPRDLRGRRAGTYSDRARRLSRPGSPGNCRSIRCGRCEANEG